VAHLSGPEMSKFPWQMDVRLQQNSPMVQYGLRSTIWLERPRLADGAAWSAPVAIPETGR
jgi:hypothetical protein